LFLTVSCLAIWAHLKTMLTDPGAVPLDAQPLSSDADPSFCPKCDAYKPRTAYHCSKCRRCIARMDHHCPYTNNCVGALNQKHMILFLFYCNIEALYALVLVGYYGSRSHGFYSYEWLERILAIFLALDGLFTLAFTGTMMRRQILSIVTGVGTIDRLKLAKGKPIAGGTPLPLSAVFGDATPLLWWLPIDPDFGDSHDAILGLRNAPPASLKDSAFDPAALTSAATPLLVKPTPS